MGTYTTKVKIPNEYSLIEEYCCTSIKDAIEKQKQQKRLHYLEDYKILRRDSWVFVFRHQLSIRLEAVNNKFNNLV